MKMKNILPIRKPFSGLAIVLMMLTVPAQGQVPDTLTLEFCRNRAVEVYPLSAQKALNVQATDLQTENLDKNYLPEIGLNGKATYQSEVTQVPVKMPGINIPTPDKDMYDLYLSLSQTIWDGGVTHNKKALEQADLQISQQQVDVQLYQVKERVNGLYFRILLAQKSHALLVSNRETINEKLGEIRSGIRHGVILPSSADALQAQVLQIDQNLAELNSNINALFEMLGQLLEMQIPPSTPLVLPHPEIRTNDFVNRRPEYELLGMQQHKLELSKDLVSATYLPKFSGFGKLGYGKPGLNMLSNSFTTYYYVGVGLSWNILNWNKQKNQKKLLDVKNDILETQRRTFDKNVNIQVSDDLANIRKYEEMIAKDADIISLREKIRLTASSQLDNGTITSSQYIDELNRETRARLDQEMHRIRLSKARVDYLKTIGAL